MSAQAPEVEGQRPWQRAHDRAPLAVAVDMESENNFYAGITDNISEGGVFVATHTPPPRGAVVDLHLALPGIEPFAVRAEVCWIRDLKAAGDGAPPGCGLRWVEVSREALAAIAKFVHGRATILYDVD